MSRLPKGFIASTSQEGQEAVERNTLCVTLLSREWRSSTDRDLSTVNRELAIQLAKHPGVQVSVFLPRCSEDDKRIAASHKVQLIEAEEMTGVDPVDWLINIPEDHVMDCIIGHGVHLGRQIPVIQQGHQCKWIQIVHNVPEALAMYKNNADAISRAEKMQQTEIELCELADQVVAVGPKLADTYRRFIRSSEKHQDVIDLTPSIFTEFLDVKQAVEERQTFCVLVIGSGDSEDFNLKGYDLAAQAIAELKETSYQLKFVCAPRGRGDEIAEKLLEHDIDRSQLIVRSFNESRETLARLFCEVDLAIMPSRSEGFGLTALEALSAGLPVLVSSNSGLGEALMKVPYGSNCVVDSEDPKHWASKIKAVRGKDRDVRLAESKLLREKYLEKYSWEKHCGVLVEKMQKLVTGSYGHSGPPSFLKYSQSPFPAGPQTPAQTYQTGHPQSSSSHDRPPSSLEHNQSHFLADCQTPVQTYQTSHPQSSFSHDRPPSLLEHKTGPQTPVQTYQTSHPQSSSVQGRPPLSVEHNQLSFPACSQTPVQTSQRQSHHPQIYWNMASPWPIADIKGHLSEIVNEKEDVNILILGEIGVGKSTWINGIANYAKHNTLRDAMDDPEFTVLISSRFFFTTDEGEEKEISFGSDANEVLESGQSATQFPQEHVLETDTTRFHLIDTPGIGDCRGIEKDKENVQNILAFLTCYNKLNSVVVLLKPNSARLTVAFKFCVLEMLTHLHRSLVSNIIFAFTNSRGTFYRPGDSLPVLKNVLQRNKIEINVSPSNYFCFDNEGFRFLACYKSGIQFTSVEVDSYSRSWVKSWDTTCKLFDLVENLKPHDTKKTLSLNEARNCIIAMNKPMDQAVQLIEINLQKIKEVRDRCKVLSADIRSFQAELHFKGFELEIKKLDHPMTVCAAETCKKYVNIGKSGERNTVYEQVCHDHCYCLKEMPDGTTNKEQLRKCLAMSGGKCTQCSFNCDYTVHMRIDHTSNLVEKEFLSDNAQRKIKELSDLKSERKSFIEELEKKTRELQNEKDFIYDCASYYGVFLKENAIIPYNDSFREYLDMLIMEEEAKEKVIRDDKKIQNLKKDKQAYEMKKDAIMTNIASGCKDKNEFIPLEMIYEMRQKLCSLKHNGKTLKKALDGVISARQRQYGLKRKSRVVARTKNNSQGTSSLARFNPFSRKANFNPRYY